MIDRYQFKEDIGGYLTNRWSHLKLLDLATPQAGGPDEWSHDDVPETCLVA